MSKLYSEYQRLKQNNSENIYLFKIGVFYIAIEDDAKLLSNIYNLKLTNLNSNIVKCGFPCSSFDKYYMQFVNDNINFKIIENSILFNGSDYLQNQKINTLLDKIKQINVNNLSVSEAYHFIEELQQISLSIKQDL